MNTLPDDTRQSLEFTTLFEEHRPRLHRLVQARMSRMLFHRMTAEDMVQEVYMASAKRIPYFVAYPEIPYFVKLRSVALQTITDFERKYLAAKKRNVYQEINPDQVVQENEDFDMWNLFADPKSSPLTRVAKQDRYALLHGAMEALSVQDREMIQMRNFEGLTNMECANVLEIEPKAASIRYIRALKRLQELLIEFSEFNG